MTDHLIRIASYNVRGFKDDRDALLRVVHAIAPDVLLLQEVPRHPFSGHRIAKFAAESGLTWSAGKRFRMSTTLLTSLRIDLQGCEHVPLPVTDGDEPRGYCAATVALPGHRAIEVASIHLSLRGEDRKLAVPLVLDALRASQLPIVVGGDLNETPGHAVWESFGRRLQEVAADKPTYPSSGPIKRIDAIFASPSLPATTPTVGWDTDDLARATDHLPVVVDLDVSALAQ